MRLYRGCNAVPLFRQWCQTEFILTIKWCLFSFGTAASSRSSLLLIPNRWEVSESADAHLSLLSSIWQTAGKLRIKQGRCNFWDCFIPTLKSLKSGRWVFSGAPLMFSPDSTSTALLLLILTSVIHLQTRVANDWIQKHGPFSFIYLSIYIMWVSRWSPL